MNDGVHVVLLDQNNTDEEWRQIKNKRNENTGGYLPCEDIDYDIEWHEKVIDDRSGRTKLCFSQAAELDELLKAIKNEKKDADNIVF